MTGIKAFVGHSFTEEDDAVVSSFLEFFSRLGDLLEGFAWTHAKKAEPKELAEKVLQTIDDCNTLIAICTRKELVTAEKSVSSSLLNRSVLKVNETDVESKTSDWVIQEIGLAVGRQMSLIILLEDGCRLPGGLQGNIEYIPFHRAAPEKAQGKLLEMLRALRPTGTAALPQARDVPEDTETPANEPPSDNLNEQPDASWSIEKFEDQYFWAILRNNDDRASHLNEQFLVSVHAKSDVDRVSWMAKIESWRIIWSKGGRLSDIRSYFSHYPDNPSIITSLASALSHLGEEQEAAELYEKAAQIDPSAQQSVGFLSTTAYCYVKAGRRDQAEAALERIKNAPSDDRDLNIARALRSFAQAADEIHTRIEAMEVIAHLNPGDYENRFSLAYAHSDMGNSEMALHHYQLIPSSERSPVAWNNLGVAYQNLSVPGRAVHAYKRSANDGETLAMSNLAYRYMNAGFLDEATTQLRAAMNQKDPHKNVGDAYSRLIGLPEEETKSLAEIESKAAVKIALYRELGAAALKPKLESIPSQWVGPKGPVAVILDGSTFNAEWEYSVQGNSLTGLLATKASKYRVELRGKLLGRRVYGKLKHRKIEGSTSLLGDAETEHSFAIIFSDDLTKASVAENLEKRSPTFYELSVADEQNESVPAD